MKPMNTPISCTIVGTGHSWIDFIRAGFIVILFGVIKYPKYSVFVVWKSHFFRLVYNLCSLGLCFSSLSEIIKMSYRNTTQIILISHWKAAGVLIVPNGTTVYSEWPQFSYFLLFYSCVSVHYMRPRSGSIPYH